MLVNQPEKFNRPEIETEIKARLEHWVLATKLSNQELENIISMINKIGQIMKEGK